MTTDLAELTSDPFEHQILEANYVDPIDRASVEDVATRILLLNLKSLQSHLYSRHMNWARQFLSGLTPAQISTKAGVAYTTVHAALKKPKIREFMTVIGRLQRIEAGPTLKARRDLLWRIAERTEESAPRTSIAAVDLLNKQEGVYLPETLTDSAVQITINNFSIAPPPKHEIKDVVVVEGEFTPVLIQGTKNDD